MTENNWKTKVNFEVRVFEMKEKLTDEEKTQLKEEMEKDGYILEDVVEMDNYDGTGKTYDYRFARY